MRLPEADMTLGYITHCTKIGTTNNDIVVTFVFTGEGREEALLLHHRVEELVLHYRAPVRETHSSRKQQAVAVLRSPPRLLSVVLVIHVNTQHKRIHAVCFVVSGYLVFAISVFFCVFVVGSTTQPGQTTMRGGQRTDHTNLSNDTQRP